MSLDVVNIVIAHTQKDYDRTSTKFIENNQKFFTFEQVSDWQDTTMLEKDDIL